MLYSVTPVTPTNSPFAPVKCQHSPIIVTEAKKIIQTLKITVKCDQ